tara:strand:- start:806 stop:1582 length:777 start_codon:yes stop_codon:yes gene_type:complete
MLIEIVVHCFRFSRVLAYQLSSLVLWPPKKTEFRLSVFCGEEEDDSTMRMLSFFISNTNIGERSKLWIHGRSLPNLLNRAIGRNFAAKQTTADVVWFCDADYVFGDGYLDALAETCCQFQRQAEDKFPKRLLFPREIQISNTHELGDDYARRVTQPAIVNIDPKDFKPHRIRKAIGGLQVVPGHIARKYGYCDGQKRTLKPRTDSTWKPTTCDIRYRKSLNGGKDWPGTPIDLPNLFRIRQSVAGVVDTVDERHGDDT